MRTDSRDLARKVSTAVVGSDVAAVAAACLAAVAADDSQPQLPPDLRLTKSRLPTKKQGFQLPTTMKDGAQKNPKKGQDRKPLSKAGEGLPRISARCPQSPPPLASLPTEAVMLVIVAVVPQFVLVTVEAGAKAAAATAAASSIVVERFHV